MYKFLSLMVAVFPLLAACGGGSSSTTTSNSTQAAEKAWVRAHLDDVYLWNNEIISVPPSSYATAPDYFDALLVRAHDRFSFSMPVAEAASTLDEGLETGYGVSWGWAAPGRLYAYYVDPSSPAAASITRGTEVTAINGQAVATASNSYLNRALFPTVPGASVVMTYRTPGTTTSRTNSVTSATFPITTVQHPVILTLPAGGKIGYLLFNEHLRTSEQGLINAFSYLQQQGVSELVLDMRYNPGGYLFIAEEVASMIGGSTVQGRTFEKLLFNGRHPEKTNDPNSTMSFSAHDSKGGSLPLLGLSRVFVLTGQETCSASESVINGLLPFVQVVRIGWTTCGKPYGSMQANYDQNAYFALEIEGVNATGTSNYESGFTPTCQIPDDLNYPLGDIREPRLNAAVYYMTNNSCPPTPSATLPRAARSGEITITGDAQLFKHKPGLKLVK